jgi:RimJ/RimL family protein N-acetyltransferase
MDFSITALTEPTQEIADLLNRWENDSDLIPFIRPIKSKEDQKRKKPVTVESLKNRLDSHEEYMICLRDRAIGEMSVQIDPEHLARKEANTAWIGIYIGDNDNRGKGAGTYALNYLEKKLKERGIRRMELGVFEFNTNAFGLYEKLGFKEFARIDAFTWWQEMKWKDIRMEKYLE